MHEGISECFETVLSKCQFGFRRNYSTQDYLLATTEKKASGSGEQIWRLTK